MDHHFLFFLRVNCPTSRQGNALPFPDREVFVEGQQPTTCGQLEVDARTDPALCNKITLRSFYCGCPCVVPACTLCPGSLTPVPNLVLKGFAPDFFLDTNACACAKAERQCSVVTSEEECNAAAAGVDEVAMFCGCHVPSSDVFFTTICPDDMLVDEEFLDAPALVNQSFMGSLTCREHQLTMAEGKKKEFDCHNANYVGIKRCGCSEPGRPYCDMCEDGSGVEDLVKDVTTFQLACLDYVGDTHAEDAASEQ